MTDKYIEILIELESVIEKAGKLAIDMRSTAKSHNKYQTGEYMIDVVTEADLAVQELILSEIAKTELVNCHLVAEEKTDSISKFTGINGLTLTLDPIDGTFLYTSDGIFWSIIICLYDGETPLYTLIHYPVVGWSRRITQNEVTDIGELPRVKMLGDRDYSKVITRTYGDLSKLPEELTAELKQKGYVFMDRADLTEESGSTTMLFLNQVGGFFIEKPGAYDGLSALSYAKTKGLTYYSDIDLSKILEGDHGPYYDGWYLVLNSPL